MKYKEPNMQILLMNNEDIVRTSTGGSVTYDPDQFPSGGSEQFPVPKN